MYKTDDFFTATPPLESLRLLLALAASGAQDIKIEVLDARKAHLHAFADRTVFTQPPMPCPLYNSPSPTD